MKYLKNNRWVVGLIVIIILIATFVVFDSKNGFNVASVKNYQRLDNIGYDIGSSYVEFLYLKDFPDNGNGLITSVSKDDFPKLFSNLDSLSMVQVKPYKAEGKQLFILSNVSPDHGGISYNYSVILDIFNNNKILFDTSNILEDKMFAKIYIDDSNDLGIYFLYSPKLDFCVQCGLEINEFYTYDEKQDKFVSNNLAHKDKIKKTADGIKEYNSCSPELGATKMTFSDIKEKYSENQQCKSSDSGLDTINGLTPKEYFTILQVYENILSGKEDSILDMFSSDKLRNATYKIGDREFKMVNGSYNDSSSKEEVFNATLDNDHIVYNGDKVVVIVTTNEGGGTGKFQYLVVYSIKDNEPQYLSDVLIGDRAAVNNISISGSRIKVLTLNHGPDDAMCCPTQNITLTYDLTDDNKLEEEYERNN